MESRERASWTAFEGPRCIASGAPAEVAPEAKEAIDRGGRDAVLIFDDATGEQVEVDFRGTAEDVRKRLTPEPGPEPEPEPGTGEDVPERPGREGARGPGRPRLGVVAREVTLLPRHWDWLNGQPGGASVALRRLVEEARRANEGRDRARRSREAAYRFMSAMAGDLPGFEEATRALFAANRGRLGDHICGWPEDIRTYLARLAEESLRPETAGTPAARPAAPSGDREMVRPTHPG